MTRFEYVITDDSLAGSTNVLLSEYLGDYYPRLMRDPDVFRLLKEFDIEFHETSFLCLRAVVEFLTYLFLDEQRRFLAMAKSSSQLSEARTQLASLSEFLMLVEIPAFVGDRANQYLATIGAAPWADPGFGFFLDRNWP